ncbi:SusC/RagA family TonB-linked outer membrane protein [Sphingobacterium faecale]|uniref:SusC/RagA family TonB-linked outer membrane protein n=1 Tax=Sphingobacterium faecale TaxID=2803775 RepID=A0ABS1R396_9SPHI|nr:SusC/RagA family TonB-linked outer membrane protein [Sphingobacterium faecale]MBL1409172.1 SusC/RagA family TonB-linked outer membrane protein [Sphingobacterium faecale]
MTLKLTIAALLLCSSQVNAFVYSQNINLTLKDKSLKDAFSSISKQSGYHFLYLENDIRNIGSISLNLTDIPLQDALKKTFENTNLTYAIRGKRIIVEKRGEKTSPVTPIVEQQQSAVRGRVVGAGGEYLAGVTVQNIQGETTSTNNAGEFSVQAKNGDVLLITFVGYEPHRVSVGTQKEYNIKLQLKVDDLDEVVVVAYGTAKKSAYTGSATQLNADKFKDRPLTSVTNSLLGEVSGVQVSTASGQPGSDPTIHIRGIGTISSSVNSTPLIVVNGMPYDNPLNTINPTDIESLTVLKDASSAALYGARGANGVILIQTKGGKKDKQTVGFKLNQGFTAPQTGDYKKLGVADYLLVNWESTRNMLLKNGMTLEQANKAAAENLISNDLKYNPFNVPDNQVVDASGKLNPDASFMWGEDTDWLKSIQRLGMRTDAALNLSGGTGKSDYYLSTGYLSEKGYIIGSKFDRYTINGNINSKITSFLKVGGMINGVLNNMSGLQNESSGNNSNPFRFVRYIGPIYPIHMHNPVTKDYILDNRGNRIYDFGTGYEISDNLFAPSRDYVGGTNPVLELQNVYDGYKRNLLNAKVYAEIQIIDGLKFTTNGSVSADARLNSSASVVYPEKQNSGNISKSNSFTTTWTFNQLLSYTKKIDQHHIDILAGHESYDYEYNYLLAKMSDQRFDNGNYEFPNYSVPGDQASRTDRYRTEGYLSRVNYDYANKYMISASVRRDGTSRFYQDYRWGTFFSIGAGWRLDQEHFIKDLGLFDLLKLRASYGGVGNDDIGTYYAWQASYVPADNGLEPGYIRDRELNSRSLQWEVSHSSDIALEFGLLKNRLSGSIEFFNRQSSNLLFKVPQAPDAGLTFAYQNAGSLYNRGLELALNGQPIHKNGFVWDIGFNVTYLKNKITELPVDPYNSGMHRIEKGHSRYEFYLRQWAGVDPATGSSIYIPTAEVLNTYLEEPDAAKRSASIVDINGTYYTTTIAEAMYDWSGVSMPTFSGGFNTGLAYNGIALNLLFNYQLGGTMYDTGYNNMMTGPSGSALIGSTRHTDILNRWQQPGDITDVPRLGDASDVDLNAGSSTRWLVSSNMLELANVTASYELPKKILETYHVSGLRVYFSADNAFLISKRQGMYPRKNIFSGYSGNADVYLPSRVFTLGLNLTF